MGSIANNTGWQGLLTGPDFDLVVNDDTTSSYAHEVHHCGTSRTLLQEQHPQMRPASSDAILITMGCATTRTELEDASGGTLIGVPTTSTAAQQPAQQQGQEVAEEEVSEHNQQPGKHFADVKQLQMVQPGQLEALPFKPPTFPEHLVQIFLATIQVAQYIITMYMAIMVAQNERTRLAKQPAQVSGLIKGLVVLYPAVTMAMLTFINAEMVLRKFMYYRFMSLQILVDWDDTFIWRTWFFAYFMITWVLLNVWALWGCAVLWPSSTPWTTFIVVNAQTVLMLIFFNRVNTSEASLVSVNDFIEHSPLFAKRLIDTMDVIREDTLRDECARCLREAWPNWRKWLLSMVCWKSKKQNPPTAVFSLRNLRRQSIRHPTPLSMTKSLTRKFRNSDVSKADADQTAAKPLDGGADSEPTSWIRGVFEAVVYLPQTMLHHGYASVHFLLVAFQRHHQLWPYPADLPYIRGLVAAQALAFAAVMGVEAFAIYLAVTNRSLGDAETRCSDCYSRLSDVSKHCNVTDGSCGLLFDGYCTTAKLLNGSAALAGGWAGSLANLADGYCPGVSLP